MELDYTDCLHWLTLCLNIGLCLNDQRQAVKDNQSLIIGPYMKKRNLTKLNSDTVNQTIS